MKFKNTKKNTLKIEIWYETRICLQRLQRRESERQTAERCQDSCYSRRAVLVLVAGIKSFQEGELPDSLWHVSIWSHPCQIPASPQNNISHVSKKSWLLPSTWALLFPTQRPLEYDPFSKCSLCVAEVGYTIHQIHISTLHPLAVQWRDWNPKKNP